MTQMHSSTRYPSAHRSRHADQFGDTVIPDPYRWLEDDDSPHCLRWLDEQTELLEASAVSLSLRGFFGDVVAELTAAGSVMSPVTSTPVVRGPRRFFLRRRSGQELPILMMAAGSGPDRVLLDPAAIDPCGLTTLDAWHPSWSGRLVAAQLSRAGNERPELRVLDVDTGDPVGRPVHPGRQTPVAWLPDDSGYYYVHDSGSEGLGQVRVHRLDDQTTPDAVVFQTPLRQLAVTVSGDKRWLVISAMAGGQAGNRIYLADLADGNSRAPRLLKVYDGTVDGSQALLKVGPRNLMYAITTRDAPAGRVCLVDPDRPTRDAWRTVVTLPPRHVLTGCTALVEPRRGQLRFLVSSSGSGEPRLVLYDVHGQPLYDAPTPGSGPGTLTNLTSAPGDSGQAWFLYTDFMTPAAVYRFDLADRRVHRDDAGDVPSPAGPAVTVHRVSYPADDGTRIPIYLIVPTGITDGPRPTILSAYGGFGVSAAAAYSPSVLAWVKAGGIYAIAGIRGGGEHGSQWHAAGRGTNKPKAFSDFAAAARWLHRNGLTTPRQLAIRGTSHSGLTVAVALTRDPHLYAAAVCSSPLTDMIRYPRLGAGALWTAEFGDPTNTEDRNVLLRYSPYHNVRPGAAFPAVLLTSPRRDARVGAGHARKLTAALQHATSSTNPILLRTEDHVGHGPRAASRLINIDADTLAFCAAHTGLTAPDTAEKPSDRTGLEHGPNRGT
ncbi:prolyl oligopeptidase [Mycobacterium haemophilum DSM 44634]|uniref:prolyl oligopeptidase family serine peptidase n=1 Tax=Mycobacterium haemophilum TaxID=29311 RepID=UPI0006D44C17|nr:prolyl oligopeptidase family serine peptidase [Mycobacterium haemophilum]AKN18850.2 hypothetical protein B586_17285 [Mycobacterium haemophilum DSM 44634]MCV7340616.1 S9 family peptidase [Mycobacterium haemophilum DSM 44634]